jgi:hypothetical protein
LFAVSLFLVFVGTLAQKDHDVWYVVDAYFRTWFARVDFITFERLVQIFFKQVEWNLTDAFYFPGGKLIGLLLLVNLAAAHAVRFKIEAKGRRLAIGSTIIAAGLALTYAAIQSGMNSEVESALSPAFCDLLWQFCVQHHIPAAPDAVVRVAPAARVRPAAGDAHSLAAGESPGPARRFRPANFVAAREGFRRRRGAARGLRAGVSQAGWHCVAARRNRAYDAHRAVDRRQRPGI